MKTFQRDLSSYDTVFGHIHPLPLARQRPTMENSIMYKPEVETVPQTGSTNNLATETDVDAISMAIPMFYAIPMFFGARLSLVYMPTSSDASFTLKFKMAGGYRK